tara:strand:- start:4963 stop:5094 length:132 start_codon:yes stop_codon:yes gene_type:complete
MAGLSKTYISSMSLEDIEIIDSHYLQVLLNMQQLQFNCFIYIV